MKHHLHKLFGFADVELQVIVVASCGEASGFLHAFVKQSQSEDNVMLPANVVGAVIHVSVLMATFPSKIQVASKSKHMSFDGNGC